MLAPKEIGYAVMITFLELNDQMIKSGRVIADVDRQLAFLTEITSTLVSWYYFR